MPPLRGIGRPGHGGGETVTEKELKKILPRHQLWLEGKEGGEQANLRWADLRGADLRGADLCEADLCGANLREVDLRGANLRWADLCRADLCGANLQGAYLCRADLCGANLCGADLCRADLGGANLCGADLCGANLCGANLCGANLHRANLCGANLDFSCWPLWCGSLDVTVDKRIAAQLAYHFCRVRCDDPEVQAAQKALAPLANQFHRVEECGRIAE